MRDQVPTRTAVMRFWVRWDFFLAVPIYLVLGVMLLPSVGDGLVGAAVWIVWGWVVWGCCMLIGNVLSRRHPDLGTRIEREELCPRLFAAHDEEHQSPPQDQ